MFASYLDEDGDLIYPRSALRAVRNQRLKKGVADPIWIVLQNVSRHYGGPEEGGWWYDWYSTIEVRKAYTWQSALKAVRELVKEYPQPRHSRFSVLGNSGDYQISLCYCEEHFPEETTSRPRYE